jgi:hypothetical protein
MWENGNVCINEVASSSYTSFVWKILFYLSQFSITKEKLQIFFFTLQEELIWKIRQISQTYPESNIIIRAQ